MEYLNFPEKKVGEKLELVSPGLESKKGQKGRQKRRARQIELLKEFSHQAGDFYEEKQVGDKWYVKMYNGNTDQWQVAIFTNKSFRNYKNFRG